jgi:hypothetical protein
MPTGMLAIVFLSSLPGGPEEAAQD